MRGALARAVRALAFLLLAVAPAQAQISRIVVDDLRLIEGTGPAYKVPVKVRLLDGPPTTADVTVDFLLVPGLAVTPADFSPQGATLTFVKGAEDTKIVDIEIIADGADEWDITLQQDEMFFIQLSKPSANAVLFKSRGTITLVDDDHRDAGVQYLSAVTDSLGPNPNDGRNRLQWRVPANSEVSPKNFEVCWNIGPGCVSPTGPAEAQKCDGPPFLTPLGPGEKQLFTHTDLVLPETYCYSVFTLYPAISAEVGEVATQTFDSTIGPVQWTFTPGGYAGAGRGIDVVPPSVGFDGVFSVGTDGVVYSMERSGPDGGLWPKDFFPLALGKGAHNRNPVVPLPEGSRFFVGTESGEVHSVDARTGSVVWSRAALFPPGSQQLMTSSTGTQAVPAGVFKAFGGLNDVLVMGTATAAGNTSFFELDPATGATLDTYGPADLPPGGPIDNVFGMAVVDYAKNRVYFGTNAGAFTLWGLDLGPPGTPDLKLASLPWNPQPLGAVLGTSGAPVMRNDRLYLGTDSGAASQIHALPVSTGIPYSLTHGDGQVKGFVWPDRRDGRLYFTTGNNVHAAEDDGTTLKPLWSIPVPSPSIPLQKPGTDFLYVGDANGNLVEIDVKTGSVVKPIKLSARDVQIGAPSLDNVFSMVHVGSDDGVIYAVRVPF